MKDFNKKIICEKLEITELPEGLHVGGSLDLSDTQIKINTPTKVLKNTLPRLKSVLMS